MTYTKEQTVRVLKAMSFYKFGRNRKNYRLLHGWCSDYLEDLLHKLADKMGLMLTSDGRLVDCYEACEDGKFFLRAQDEDVSYYTLDNRISNFVRVNCFRH